MIIEKTCGMNTIKVNKETGEILAKISKRKSKRIRDIENGDIVDFSKMTQKA